MTEKEIIFAIHDLHQRGGQDRSTLEIAEHIGNRRRAAIHSFSFESEKKNSNITHRPIGPNIRRPALLKIIYYHAITFFRFIKERKRKRAVICATGACSLLSDIIHVQFVHSAWKKNPHKKPASQYERLVEWYNLLTEKMTFSKRKTYIAISHAVKKDLETEYGLQNIVVVHHGVDPKKFFPISKEMKAAKRRELKIGDGTELLLIFAGSYDRKGLETIVRSLPFTPANVKLIAVGSGDRAKFRHLSVSLGIGDRTKFLSPKSNIEEYFSAADIFVFPTSYEPFGLVILEAMASGLATVVSKIAGGAELIDDGVNGILLQNPADEQALAAEISRLALDDSYREKMGAAARKLAEQRNWDVVSKEYESVVTNYQKFTN